LPALLIFLAYAAILTASPFVIVANLLLVFLACLECQAPKTDAARFIAAFFRLAVPAARTDVASMDMKVLAHSLIIH
jgi:hypothetical protein